MATRPRKNVCQSDDLTVGGAQRPPFPPENAPATHAVAGDQRPHLEPVSALLAEILTRSDGWLRLVPHVEDDELYIKWKYTRGTWTGYYVMVRVHIHQLTSGLELLQRKLERVTEGVTRPVYDTPYNS